MITTRLLAAAAALGAALTAQHAPDAVAPDRGTGADRPIDAIWPLPIQRATDVDGSHGIWTAGRDYKASFHDGFTFYPVLGDAYPDNLPLRWTRTVLPAGIADPADLAPARFDDHRFERPLGGGVTEVYEVRADSIEQRFVLYRAIPGRVGDLVLTGAIDTTLTCAPVDPPVHGGLVFYGPAGEPILSYGAAIVFDAAGVTATVRTGFDGRSIRLVVDADFLDRATYPVTVDPIIRSRTISSSSGFVESVDVTRDDRRNRLLMAWSRASAANDYDAFCIHCDDEFLDQRLLWNDLFVNSVLGPKVAVANAANAWVISVARIVRQDRRSFAYVHLFPAGTTAANTGRLFEAPTSGRQQSDVQIGGLSDLVNDTRICLVWREDESAEPANTWSSRVVFQTFDCATETFGTRRVVSRAQSDGEDPSLCRDSGTRGESWLVAWRQLVSGQHRVFARHLRPDGSMSDEILVDSMPGGRQAITPKVDGAQGRYLLGWVELDAEARNGMVSGSRVVANRLNWPLVSSAVVFPSVQVATSGTLPHLQFGRSRSLASDHLADRTLWGLAYRRQGDGLRIARLGADGAVADDLLIDATDATRDPRLPGVCFDDDLTRFVTIYANAVSDHVRAADYVLPLTTPTTTGAECGVTIRARTRFPSSAMLAGDDQVALEASSPRRSSNLVLLAAAGLAATPIPLPLSDGCMIRLDPASLFVALQTPRGPFNPTSVALPLPSSVRGAVVHWQWVELSGTTTFASPALTTQIR